jgi:hypothetical protein
MAEEGLGFLWAGCWHKSDGDTAEWARDSMGTEVGVVAKKAFMADRMLIRL